MPQPIDGPEVLGPAWGELEEWPTTNGTSSLEGREYGVVFRSPATPNLGWNLGHVRATDDPDVIEFAGKLFRLEPA